MIALVAVIRDLLCEFLSKSLTVLGQTPDFHHSGAARSRTRARMTPRPLQLPGAPTAAGFPHRFWSLQRPDMPSQPGKPLQQPLWGWATRRSTPCARIRRALSLFLPAAQISRITTLNTCMRKCMSPEPLRTMSSGYVVPKTHPKVAKAAP